MPISVAIEDGEESIAQLMALVNPVSDVIEFIVEEVGDGTLESLYSFFVTQTSLRHDTKPYWIEGRQTVRLPEDLFGRNDTSYEGTGKGTCLDLSLLCCAVLDRAGLSPVLVLVGQNGEWTHALAGCCAVAGNTGASLRDRKEDIRQLAANSTVTLFETTAFCKYVDDRQEERPVVTFTQACKQASQIIKDCTKLRLYDIRAARDQGIVVDPREIDGYLVYREPRYEPIHRGTHANIYRATPESSSEDRVIHLLREDKANDAQIGAWFDRRKECWKQLQDQEHVVSIYEPTTTMQKPGCHYLIADFVPGERNLQDTLDDIEEKDEFIRQVVALAAEVCQKAHEKRIYLTTLPLRHFLMDDENRNIWLTGFDTAIGTATPLDEPLATYFKRVLRNSDLLDLLAPELRAGRTQLAPTADVFALGMLLAQLRGVSHSPMDSLPPGDWKDKWKCLIFHCLASDSNIRFQTIEQFLMFLGDCADSSNEMVRATLPVKMPDGSCLAISKFAVTNRDYRKFCLEAKHPRPRHLLTDDDGKLPLARYAAPWFPVTHVNVEDAQAYCHWLSLKDGMNWRLPYEQEWMIAAGYSKPSGHDGKPVYPWGANLPEHSLANYDCHYHGPTVIGAFPQGASEAGLCDMAGNVREWCLDRVAGRGLRILKGGSFLSDIQDIRVDSHNTALKTRRTNDIGFRVVHKE